MANDPPNLPHVTDSQPDVTGQSPQTQGGVAAAEASRSWYPLLDQIRGDTSRHLEEYLTATNAEVGVMASSALPNYTGLGCQYVDAALAAQKLQADLEALGDVLMRMRCDAIHCFKRMTYAWVFFTALATPIAVFTPLYKEDCISSVLCPLLSVVLWVLPVEAGGDAVKTLILWYVVNRCRVKTDTLLKRLAEGSLELRDKSRLSGYFPWGLIGQRLDRVIRQRSQEGSQQDITVVSSRDGGDIA